MASKARAATPKKAAAAFATMEEEWRKLDERWLAMFTWLRARGGADHGMPTGWGDLVSKLYRLTKDMWRIACTQEIDKPTADPVLSFALNLKTRSGLDRRWPQLALIPLAFRPDAAAWRDDCWKAIKRIALILSGRSLESVDEVVRMRTKPNRKGRGRDYVAVAAVQRREQCGEDWNKALIAKDIGCAPQALSNRRSDGRRDCPDFWRIWKKKQAEQRGAKRDLHARRTGRDSKSPVDELIEAEESGG